MKQWSLFRILTPFFSQIPEGHAEFTPRHWHWGVPHRRWEGIVGWIVWRFSCREEKRCPGVSLWSSLLGTVTDKFYCWPHLRLSGPYLLNEGFQNRQNLNRDTRHGDEILSTLTNSPAAVPDDVIPTLTGARGAIPQTTITGLKKPGIMKKKTQLDFVLASRQSIDWSPPIIKSLHIAQSYC